MAIIDPNAPSRREPSGALRSASWFMANVNESGPILDRWPQAPGSGKPGTKQKNCTDAKLVCDHAAEEACKKKFGKKKTVLVTLPSGRQIWQEVWEADKKTCPLDCQIKYVPVPCKPPPPPPSPCQGAGGKDCCGSYKGGPVTCFSHGPSCTNLEALEEWSNMTYCGKK